MRYRTTALPLVDGRFALPPVTALLQVPVVGVFPLCSYVGTGEVGSGAEGPSC